MLPVSYFSICQIESLFSVLADCIGTVDVSNVYVKMISFHYSCSVVLDMKCIYMISMRNKWQMPCLGFLNL